MNAEIPNTEAKKHYSILGHGLTNALPNRSQFTKKSQQILSSNRHQIHHLQK